MEIKQIRVGQLDTNCYILKTDKEVFIVDPGGDPQEIVKHVKNQKVKIINTHYHYDHTIANEEIKKKFNAEILIHEDEKKYIDFEADRFLKEGDILKINSHELEVLHTPGHTEGSICLIGEGFVITGDTLFEGGYGRTDLPGGDHMKMFKSLKKLDNIIKENTTIYPGHGEPFIWAETFSIC